MKRIKRILMFISVLVMCTAFIPVNTVKRRNQQVFL